MTPTPTDTLALPVGLDDPQDDYRDTEERPAKPRPLFTLLRGGYAGTLTPEEQQKIRTWAENYRLREDAEYDALLEGVAKETGWSEAKHKSLNGSEARSGTPE